MLSILITHKAFIIRGLCALCLILTLVFIFGSSSEDSDTSGYKSAAATTFINTLFANTGVPLQLTEHQVRKTAHASEYMVLGFLLMLNLRLYTYRIGALMAWPLLTGLLTAVLDEYSQLFTPGRSGQVSDVVIDFGGIIAGVLFCMMMIRAMDTCHRDASQRDMRDKNSKNYTDR